LTMDVTFLPTLNACLNSLSAVLLAAGYIAVKRGRKIRHRNIMIAALASSGLFLTSYLVYHYQIGSKPYEGVGNLRKIYFTILLTHTVLATALVPLVPITVVQAFRGRLRSHRRIARWTLPIWFYVSVTGVVIYLMLYGI
jgi:putative membrane protein